MSNGALEDHSATAARGGGEITTIGLAGEGNKRLKLGLEARSGEGKGGDETRRVDEARREPTGGDGGVEVIDATVGMERAL